MKDSDLEGISPEHGSSVLSRYFFFWFNPMVMVGNQRPLNQEDLWKLADQDRAKYILNEYRVHRNPSHSIFWRITSFSWEYLSVQLVGSLLMATARFSGPFFLYQIVSKLQDSSIDRYTILPWLFGMLSFAILNAILEGQVFYIGIHSGTRARTALIDELYMKTLHRVQGASNLDTEETKTDMIPQEQATLGKIVTLMSVDVERIRWFFFGFERLLVYLPITLIVSVGSLFLVLGWAAIAGVGVALGLSVISYFLGNNMINYEQEQLANTDARVTLINEMLQGIRIIKYFAWEPYFLKKIDGAREKELKSMLRLFITYMGFGLLGSSSSILIALATFYTHVVLLGKSLDAATAFTSIKLLGEMKEVMMNLPTEVLDFIQAKVSFDRITRFLSEKDLDKYAFDTEEAFREHHVDSPSTAIVMENSIGFKDSAEFRYYGTGESFGNSNDQVFSLRNLEINFPYNRLSVVYGPTGSGKTSLLLALLGEMECLKGRYHLPKSDHVMLDPSTGFKNTVAYVPQTAWLLNATIRDNILFGEEFDAERYDSVIRGCALVKDFENLDGGDLTEIGEKGINVSGGQKQRISLARACYSRASTVFLDDPLSAVDAPTARFLLYNAILELLKGRTIILVSHATHLVLPYANWVVSIKNGEVAFQGTAIQAVQEQTESVFEMNLTKEEYEGEDDGLQTSAKVAVTAAAGTGTTLVEEEGRSTGAVKLSIYGLYCNAAGGLSFFIVVFVGFFLSVSSRWVYY